MKIEDSNDKNKLIKITDIKKSELYHSGYSFKKSTSQDRKNEDQGFDKLLKSEIERIRKR